MGHLGAFWGHLGAMLGHLGTLTAGAEFVAHFSVHLGASWGSHGAILGRSKGYLEVILRLSWAVLGHLEPLWGQLGNMLGHLGAGTRSKNVEDKSEAFAWEVFKKWAKGLLENEKT